MQIKIKDTRKQGAQRYEISFWRSRDKPLRFYRKTEEEAKEVKSEIQSRLKQYGRSIFDFTPKQLNDLRATLAILPSHIDLLTAVHGFIEGKSQPGVSVTGKAMSLEECQKLFMKEKENRSQIYRHAIKTCFNRVNEHFGEIPITTIFPEDIQDFLDSFVHYSAESKKNFRRILNTFFKWCSLEDYITTNPVEKVKQIEVTRGTPQFFSSEDVTLLFKAAMALDPELIPFLAVSAFAGIRSFEVDRIFRQYPGDIRVKDREIYVRAEVAKAPKHKPRPRLLEDLPDNLWTWLEYKNPKTGEPYLLDSASYMVRRQKLYQNAGFEWIHSGLRHTFITHSVPVFGIEKTAQWSGHIELATMKDHYQGIIGKRGGNLLFYITPETVRAFKKAA